MKSLAFVAAVLGSLSLPTLAADHDNMDAGRPLSFDDAEAVGFRERAFEIGIAPHWSGRNSETHVTAEFLWGLALNSHLIVDLDPSFAGTPGQRLRHGHLGAIGLGIFHNLNRETLERPAFAVRIDHFSALDHGGHGTDSRWRAIGSKSGRGSERFHVNIDLIGHHGASSGERRWRMAGALGYTRPIGYPARFDQTLAAELTWRQDILHRGGGVAAAGVGLRQQVSPRAVADLGFQRDLSGNRFARRDRLRLTMGLSTTF